MKDTIGNRMKNNYEERAKFKLVRRTPVIIRLDGKCFHTFTRGMKKPFDEYLSNAMINTAEFLCREIQGVKCAYVQSDEISLLLTDFDKLETDAYFDYEVQKIASVSASLCTARFSWYFPSKTAIFDSRVFNIPKEEVVNYFVWRQKDWERNSLSMFARTFFSQNQLNKMKRDQVHEMLFKKGENWAKLPRKWKNGVFMEKENDFKRQYFIFTQNRERIGKYTKEEYYKEMMKE